MLKKSSLSHNHCLAKSYNTANKATSQYLILYTYIPFSCSNTMQQIVTVHIPNLPVQAICINSLEYKNCAKWLYSY
jgi:hypothetical protein